MLLVGYALSLSVFVGANRYFTGNGTWPTLDVVWAALLPAILLMGVLMGVVMRFHIRRSCAKWGLKVLRIRARRSHYKVTYLLDGKELTEKWPDDFKRFTADKHESSLRLP